MNRQRYNLWLVLAAAVGLIVVHEYAPDGLYSFGGHARSLHWLLVALVALLGATHGFIAIVLWTQRRKWDAADAGTFLFVCVKALFWVDLAFTLKQRPGIDLTTTYLFVIILLSTINLDAQLVRRYFFERADAATDARQGDPSGTAAGVRMTEHADAWTDGTGGQA